MELPELLKALAEKATNEDERKAVAAGLAEHVQGVHQLIFNSGYARANAKASTLEEKVTAAEAKVTELTESLKAAQKGDTALLQHDLDHWKGEAQRLKGQLEDKDKGFAAREREGKRLGHVDRMRTKLRGRLQDDYADRVARDPEVNGRIRLTDKDEVEVLVAGKDIPITVPEGRDPIDFLVEEIVKGSAPVLVKAGGDHGSDTQAGGGGADKGIATRSRERFAARRAAEPNPLTGKTGEAAK